MARKTRAELEQELAATKVQLAEAKATKDKLGNALGDMMRQASAAGAQAEYYRDRLQGRAR